MKEMRGGWHRDGIAPDGEFADGLRWVRPGGRVKAATRWFKGECLLPFVGQQVYLCNMDYWYQSIQAFTHPVINMIGTLEVEP